jgi:hypothetical protein
VLRVTFRNFTLPSLETALSTLELAGPFDFQLSLLGFKDIRSTLDTSDTCFASVLCTAARLSPREFLFNGCCSKVNTQPLPNFHGTTSIQINLQSIELKPLPGRDFSDLERLSLSCNIVNLATLVTLCPRLLELRVTEARGVIKVHSKSLQKLDISTAKYMHCHIINVSTPALKDLKLVVHDNEHTTVSILAPTVEKIWWEGFYELRFWGLPHVFRFWSLQCLRLETEQDTCSCSLRVLRLHITASVRSLLVYMSCSIHVRVIH